ncbi:hypothetical protein GGS24DRAFT_496065 [Hypoxylon argillaceum]|nr:hypothetical protein GGS24DRAFT_496065 [Hypoxylon argillaceum]
MLQHNIFRLSIVLIAQVFLAGILAVPTLNHVVNPEDNLIVSDGLENSALFSTPHVEAITETVTITAEPDMAIITVNPIIVTVTVTAIETTFVDTSSSDLAGTAATNITSPAADLVTPFQHASSTSSRLRSTQRNSTVTKFTTATPKASASSHTSNFNNDLCDDIFCNTDGNKVCIYWAGITSWDVSLGAIPGRDTSHT